LFAAKGEQYVRHPTYWVFDLYRPHMGAKRVPLRVTSPDLTVPVGNGDVPLFSLDGSASVREGKLALTLVSLSLDEDVAASIRLTGAGAREPAGRVLTHQDPHAENSFDSPEEVQPTELPVTATGNELRARIPKNSVASIEVQIT
jgi:alpha-N-arabinofuranosidase